jgi:arylsulfatase A-like enzyme
MAGVAAPDDRAIDGASVLPLFEGQPVRRKTPLYWRYDRALTPQKTAMRDGDYKILADETLERFELFNLKDDPGEKRDLAVEQSQRAHRMVEQLRRLHESVEAEAPSWPDLKRPR